MSEITMCKNKYCPLKYKCYRYTAIPNRFHSYATFYYDQNEGCNSLVEIEEYEERCNDKGDSE